MYNFVRKVIAKDGEREYVDSNAVEMEEFIVRRMRDEFKDKSIICIKFEVSYSEDFEESQSTSWFINPYYMRDISSLIETENEVLIAFFENNSETSENSIQEIFLYPDAYGPKIDSEILPELILTNLFWEDTSFLGNYYDFRYHHPIENMTEQEYLEKFFEYLRILDN